MPTDNRVSTIEDGSRASINSEEDAMNHAIRSRITQQRLKENVTKHHDSFFDKKVNRLSTGSNHLD